MLTKLRGVCCLWLLAACALAQELPPVVAEALTRAGIPASAVGTYVQEVNGAAPLVASHDNVAFNPASTMKLVTSDAALELLGPTYSWKTQAYADGKLVGDVLLGDLVIKGSGDPKLVLENFWLFLRQLRAKGIREIRGNLVLDRSAFADGDYDPAVFDGDPLKPYNAGSDALLLNYKTLRFRFVPELTSATVRVTVEPPLAGFEVVAPALSNNGCGDWQSKLQASFSANNANFAGTYSASCGDKSWYLHPYQMTHGQYFGAVFRQLWSDLGGTFKGDVDSGVLPPSAVLVGEWGSPTLPEVIRDMNKFSNNVMARQLLLTLAADVLKPPATPERGAGLIQNWLAGKGIETPGLVIENGSGLSRNERIAPNTMGRMLVAAFQSPTMPELMSSLPLVALDGTMHKRLKTRGVAGHAHIKTGTLNDVRAIAGYVLAASGKRYVVVSIINHRNAAYGQEAHDALLEWVYERS